MNIAPQEDRPSGRGLHRASFVIASGTVISRLTGILRTVMLFAAVGTAAVGDAFTVANQLPNNIYAIISIGLLTAVVVPQIVRAAAHPDGGTAFVSKFLTLGFVALALVTVAATLCAPLLVALYAPHFDPAQQALATAFAYWCLPQILFYGVYALVGEILNARHVYGPYTWAPIVNNVISIAGFSLAIAVFGSPQAVSAWGGSMIAVVGGTATLGIIVQCGVLLLFWRRTAFRFRPDFRWRGTGLREITRLSSWTFLMVLVGQAAGLVQSIVLSGVSGAGPAQAVVSFAWLLFMLPYSVIVLSIGTPYFTRISEHAAARRTRAVRNDIRDSIRTTGFWLIGAAAALAAAAVPASRVFTDTTEAAQSAALILWCFLVGLVPLAVLFVLQRVFYAYNDTFRPFMFTALQGALVIGTTWAAGALLPPAHVAAGMALGQSAASTVQVIALLIVLRRKLGGLQLRGWTLPLAGFTVAAAAAGLTGWLAYLATGGAQGWTVDNRIAGALGAALIGTVTLLVYASLLVAFRAREARTAVELIRRRRGQR